VPGVPPARRPADPLHGLLDARAVKRLEQVIDGVHVEGAHGVLVVGRGKDNLRQRLGIFPVGVPGLARLRSISRWITAKPSRPGICTSRKTRSGWCSSIRSTASMPLVPCATTSTPPTWSSRYLSSSRASCSSSMMSAEMVMQGENGKLDCRKAPVPVNCAGQVGKEPRRNAQASVGGAGLEPSRQLYRPAQPRRHVVAGQLMAAAGAELVGGAHGAEAVAAAGRELVVALRAEVEVALHMRGAGRAARNLRLAQQEVKHRADAARHHEADDDPEARTHGAARRVLADVADHQEVER
jgi:hypothetical protein